MNPDYASYEEVLELEKDLVHLQIEVMGMKQELERLRNILTNSSESSYVEDDPQTTK